MSDARIDAGVLRRRRVELTAFVAGVALVGRATVAPSVVERPRMQVSAVRRARAARRRETDRQCHEPPAPASAAAHGTPEAHVISSSLMLWPVEGAINSPFGWRRSPYGGEWEWHSGIDIKGAYGTPVRATAAGEVIFARRAPGYGVLVILDHGAFTTRYAHLSRSWVRVGQRVACGDTLGALGGTGRATGPHLHYEVRLGSEPLDPECLLTMTVAGPTPAHNGHGSRACAVARARLVSHRFSLPARGEQAIRPRVGAAS